MPRKITLRQGIALESKQPWRTLRHGCLHLIVCLVFFVSALSLNACAIHLPTKVGAPVSTNYTAYINNLVPIGNITYARYFSILHGSSDSQDLPSRLFVVKNDRSEIRVTVLGEVADAQWLAERYAQPLLGLRDALNDMLPFRIKRLRLSIVLVPDGYSYPGTAAIAFISNRFVSAKYALSASADTELSVRGAVRDMGHELFHVILAINHRSRTDDVQAGGTNIEEHAAYTVEYCFELRLMGSTTKHSTGFLRANGASPSPFAQSVNSGLQANADLASLFPEDAPPITPDDPRAKQLGAICRAAIERVLESPPHG